MFDDSDPFVIGSNNIRFIFVFKSVDARPVPHRFSNKSQFKWLLCFARDTMNFIRATENQHKENDYCD
jgi:hypothetical protein